MKERFEALGRAIKSLTRQEKAKNNQEFVETQKKLHDAIEESENLYEKLKDESLSIEEKMSIEKQIRLLAKEMKRLAQEEEKIIDRGL
jgi:hypothetical protein